LICFDLHSSSWRTSRLSLPLAGDGTSPKCSIKQAALDASVKWAEQAQTDKEYGGDKFKENLAYVGKALSEFATPEMGELLKTTGLINHPEMLRVFYRIGKAMSADNKVVIGGAGNTPPKSPAQRMYPNMNP
jgi:hypothetical protein